MLAIGTRTHSEKFTCLCLLRRCGQQRHAGILRSWSGLTARENIYVFPAFVMMKPRATEASLQASYRALGLQLMVLKKIILCMVKPACKQGFIFTKEVHSYIYAYVFIQIIDADYDTISNFCKIVAGLIIMLFMIFTSGYLFIYNTLYISVSKDIRYYGQLKTIGMTSVQLKRMVYQQAIWNAVIGIPLGLIAAVVAAKIVIPQLLHIINPILSASDVVSVNVWVFLIAGCFALLTNLISCKKPAKIAGECSPIEAVRYTIGTGKVKNRKRESGGIYSMALQNMFRDKKQAVIILSLIHI